MREITVSKSLVSDNKPKKENFTFLIRGTTEPENTEMFALHSVHSAEFPAITRALGRYDTQICMDIKHIQNNQKGV